MRNSAISKTGRYDKKHESSVLSWSRDQRRYAVSRSLNDRPRSSALYDTICLSADI